MSNVHKLLNVLCITFTFTSTNEQICLCSTTAAIPGMQDYQPASALYQSAGRWTHSGVCFAPSWRAGAAVTARHRWRPQELQTGAGRLTAHGALWRAGRGDGTTGRAWSAIHGDGRGRATSSGGPVPRSGSQTNTGHWAAGETDKHGPPGGRRDGDTGHRAARHDTTRHGTA